MFISVVEMLVGLWNWCRRFRRNVSTRNVDPHVFACAEMPVSTPGGCRFAKIKKFHVCPPQMVIWVILSGNMLSFGLYRSKTPLDMDILDFAPLRLKNLPPELPNIFLLCYLLHPNSNFRVNNVFWHAEFDRHNYISLR